MAVPVISLPSGTPVTAALTLMQSKRVRRVAVHNPGALDPR
jgi:CBS domain-containing protein